MHRSDPDDLTRLTVYQKGKGKSLVKIARDLHNCDSTVTIHGKTNKYLE